MKIRNVETIRDKIFPKTVTLLYIIQKLGTLDEYRSKFH